MKHDVGLRYSLLVLAALLAAGPASAQTTPPAEVQQPAQAPPQPTAAPQIQIGPIDRPGAFLLMRNALIALDQANKTNEYSILRATASAAFQVNSTGKLSEIFAGQRREGLNLAYAAILEPKWTVEPQIEASGMIHMAGTFEVSPVPVAFDLLFTQQNGQWLLFGISVGLVKPPADAAAPAAPAPAKAAETKPAAKPATPAPAPKAAAPKPAAAAPVSAPAAETPKQP